MDLESSTLPQPPTQKKVIMGYTFEKITVLMKPPSDIQKQEMSLGVTDSEEAIIKGDFWQKREGAFSDKSKKIRKILVWQDLSDGRF